MHRKCLTANGHSPAVHKVGNIPYVPVLRAPYGRTGCCQCAVSSWSTPPSFSAKVGQGVGLHLQLGAYSSIGGLSNYDEHCCVDAGCRKQASTRLPETGNAFGTLRGIKSFGHTRATTPTRPSSYGVKSTVHPADNRQLCSVENYPQPR